MISLIIFPETARFMLALRYKLNFAATRIRSTLNAIRSDGVGGSKAPDLHGGISANGVTSAIYSASHPCQHVPYQSHHEDLRVLAVQIESSFSPVLTVSLTTPTT